MSEYLVVWGGTGSVFSWFGVGYVICLGKIDWAELY